MNLSWGAEHQAVANSIGELDALLDSITSQAREHGTIVQITHQNGCTLAIGLGRGDSMLTYFDNDGGSFTSVGDRDRDDYIVFEFGGDVSEIMGARAIPIAEARAVAREFFETGERSDLIEWEKEWA